MLFSTFMIPPRGGAVKYTRNGPGAQAFRPIVMPFVPGRWAKNGMRVITIVSRQGLTPRQQMPGGE